MLTGEELRRRGVVVPRGATADDAHVQPNGVDLSLDAIWLFSEAGSLGQQDSDRALPAREELAFGTHGWFELAAATYGIRYAEWVQLPVDCGGLCFPRSSLLRMGLHIPTAVWDAGYSGRGEGLLMVTNPQGARLQHGARIAQLVVFQLNAPVAAAYAGRYQHENC